MRRFTILMAFLLMVCSSILQAQGVQIKGKVTSSEDGSALPGASVIVKGTNVATVTDADGNYAINVPSGATSIVASFIGMKSGEIEIAGQNVINFNLEPDVVGLEEVVVTAMGIQKSEKRLGYSATKVNSEAITSGGSRSALNSLQGKVSGVNITSASGAPGSSTRVILRGFTSLKGANQPLYVVDGVPINNRSIGSTDINGGTDFGNRANDINPEDIDNITVLKGSSATALYGSRGANGVIIINTKSGKKTDDGKMKIEFASAVNFDTPLRTPLMQNTFGQGWYDGSLTSNLEENGSWGPKFDGKTRVWGHVVDNSQQIKPYTALKNNYREFFDIGKSYTNNISISNGNEDFTYYFSYGNINSDGMMPTESDSYNKNSFTFKGSAKITKRLTSTASILYNNKTSHFAETGQEQSVLDGLLQTPRDISIVDQKDYKNKFNNVDNYYTIFAQNPYYILNEHGNKMVDNHYLGSLSLDYKIAPSLTATFRGSSDIGSAHLKEWRAITKSLRANYNDEAGRVTESSFFNQEINTDFLLNYNKELDNFDVSAIVGHNFNQRDQRDQASKVIGLNIPNFYDLSNSSSTPVVNEPRTSNPYESQRRLVGVYGSLDLGFKKFINLTLTARNDWSSTLPKDNRSFFYPSVSTSFIFSEIIGANNILSFGKIRASIAKTGNDADPYQINSVFEQTQLTDRYRDLKFPLAGGINGFSRENRIGNQSLQPEITTEYEFGTDLRFFDNRFSIDFSIYNKTTTDLIWDAAIPSSTGYLFQTMNLGEISNKGIELLVTVVPIRTNDFEWRISWNFSNNKNELVKLNDQLEKIPLGGTSRLGFVGVPGQPLGVFEVEAPLTDGQGHVVVNNQGLPSKDPEVKIFGYSPHDYIMGFGTHLSYKGITLNATLDYRKGGYMYSRTKEMLYFTGNAPVTTYNDRQPFIIPNSVKEVGQDANGDPIYAENDIPIAGFDNNLNLYYNQDYSNGNYGKEFLVEKTFVKLREVSIYYTLPKRLFTNIFIKELALGITGRNLILWTPESNIYIDPEATTFGNDLRADYGEYGAFPSARSYGVNLRIGF